MPTLHMHHARRTDRTLHRRVTYGIVLLLIMFALVPSRPAHAASLTVINANDSGIGSLRQAILDANATPGLDTITFALPGAGVHTIALFTVLPAITDPVIIDGYSQPGAQANLLSQGDNAKVLIELSGRGSSGLNMVVGLKITAGNSTIRGLSIHSFGNDSASTGHFYPGIILETNGGNTIEGNFIGVDSTGITNRGNGGDGIRINDSANNRIGGTLPSARNIISGNGDNGVYVNGSAASMNVIQGNYIGTDAHGSVAIANLDGVGIVDSSSTTVGGTAPGAGNLISGNHTMGLRIIGPLATNNVAQGNFIGTNASGTSAIGNSYGVEIYSSSGNQIGGTSAGARNIISGNLADGIKIGYIGQGITSENSIQGNYIGTDVSGTIRLQNEGSGIVIAGAFNNVVGGATPGAGNLISGNGQHGIFLNASATYDNVVQGNILGMNAGAAAALGNTADGIHIESAASTAIGGESASAGNIIAYNGANGVNVVDTAYSAIGTRITSNTIFSNTLLGIDMNLKRQDTPLLSYAYNLQGTTHIRGNVIGQAGTALTLQFFINHVCDASGFGEGESLLGTATTTADSSGLAQITFTPASPLPLGQFITVLATDTANNTSKFSNCAKVVVPIFEFIPIMRR